MKLFRVAAAVGVVAWLNRKYGQQLVERARAAGSSVGLQAPKLRVRARHPHGTHQSAASAANGAYRDDRDVVGVGVLREEPTLSSSISGRDQAVDHERVPGVPPPSTVDEFDDLVDTEGAESFPASDPPSGW